MIDSSLPSQFKEIYNQENYLPVVNGITDINNSQFIKDLMELPFKLVTVEMRELDELALIYLGSEQLWWVISYFNKVVEPIDFIKDYTNVKIPYSAELEELMLLYINEEKSLYINDKYNEDLDEGLEYV